MDTSHQGSEGAYSLRVEVEIWDSTRFRIQWEEKDEKGESQAQCTKWSPQHSECESKVFFFFFWAVNVRVKMINMVTKIQSRSAGACLNSFSWSCKWDEGGPPKKWYWIEDPKHVFFSSFLFCACMCCLLLEPTEWKLGPWKVKWEIKMWIGPSDAIY